MSIREDIIGALATKLATITTGNGYEQTIESVYDYPTHFESIDGSGFHAVSIFMGSTLLEYKLGGATQDTSFNIGLRVYVEGSDEDSIRESANKAVEDINKLIFNNITLGNSTVIKTEVTTVEPPFIWLELGNIGLVDIQLNVLYRRNY